MMNRSFKRKDIPKQKEEPEQSLGSLLIFVSNSLLIESSGKCSWGFDKQVGDD